MTTITVRLGGFSLRALKREDGAGAKQLPARAVGAIRYYLSDRDSGRIEWPCPTFLPEAGIDVELELELEVENGLWLGLEREADLQGVSAQRLAEHALLYFAADLDSGWVTRRILDDLAESRAEWR
ncbi:MAG TPA: hypothetical protein VHM66_05475 [Solirubrobacterales bacterium]|nr:hypothetical protein [Solirubrobacterales bacterium]